MRRDDDISRRSGRCRKVHRRPRRTSILVAGSALALAQAPPPQRPAGSRIREPQTVAWPQSLHFIQLNATEMQCRERECEHERRQCAPGPPRPVLATGLCSTHIHSPTGRLMFIGGKRAWPAVLFGAAISGNPAQANEQLVERSARIASAHLASARPLTSGRMSTTAARHGKLCAVRMRAHTRTSAGEQSSGVRLKSIIALALRTAHSPRPRPSALGPRALPEVHVWRRLRRQRRAHVDLASECASEPQMLAKISEQAWESRRLTRAACCAPSGKRAPIGCHSGARPTRRRSRRWPGAICGRGRHCEAASVAELQFGWWRPRCCATAPARVLWRRLAHSRCRSPAHRRTFSCADPRRRIHLNLNLCPPVRPSVCPAEPAAAAAAASARCRFMGAIHARRARRN